MNQKRIGQISIVLGFVFTCIGTFIPVAEFIGNILAVIVFSGGFWLKERHRDLNERKFNDSING